jgi:chromosome segregation protein
VRLKQLEIKGFKSFADKTIINLDNQITGIVGPNGCGKSNIVDAIRWVIGEHKIRALRSDNLEDLVFNGSKSRNASGLAEVALTFENTRNLLPTEFNTVTISRKFYKNGESEYRLNDVTCRLKDITNLFLDTGVSTDSYAIIELGMVDDIIKDKDGSRRRMLEQAAGVSIYKTRKKEAKLKLDATEQDLNRIEDLLFEISNNLRTLETQAKKAEKYLVVKNEYKHISVELVKASLEDFNATYQTLNSQQQQEVDKILEFEAKIAAEDAALQKDKLILTEREQALQVLQKAFNTLVADLLKLENDKSLSQQRLQHLQQLMANTQSFLQEAEVQTQELNASIKANQQKLDEEKLSLGALQESIAKLRANLDTKRTAYDTQKAELDEQRKAKQQLQLALFENEKQVAVADNSIANIKVTLQQIQQENTNKQNDSTQQQKLIEELKQKQQEQATNLNNLITQKEQATAQILKGQAQLETLRNNLIEANRKQDATRNEFQLLKSLIESFEGYPDSIKYLHNNKEWQANAPLLGDVLDVHNDYRIAIENYLDQYLNYYVVDNAQQAYAGVQLLDVNNKGKAGFFILNEIKAGSDTNATPPNTKAAINCINEKAQYQPLIQQLLGNVFIAEQEQEAIDYKGQAVVISKSGKVIRKPQSLSGGAIGLFEGNKVGRKARLDKLQTQINDGEKVTTQLQAQIDELHQNIVGYNAQLNEQQIKSVEQQINQFQNQLVQAEARVENYTNSINQNQQRIQQLNTQQQSTIDNSAKAKQEYEAQKLVIVDKDKTIATSEQSFKVIEGEYNKASEEYYQQNMILTRQQGRISELTNEINIRNNQLVDITNKVTQSQEALSKSSADIQDTNAQLEQYNTQLTKAIEQKAVNEKELNQADASFYVFRNELAEKESAINAQRRKKEDAEGVLNSIKEKLTDMKLQLSSMKERLQIEFKVDIDEVLKGPRTTETPIDILQEESAKLRKRLDNLGDVNPMAVEAYKEVKGRHDFIQEQKADLVSAKDSLLATIDEVEQTANKKFVETFTQVRENFVKVFHALFTSEDNCDLKLLDPDQPADTPIEIYAQPKGKRPSTITQLSGGEKTLTSIAFLFAIYLIKPAPFCVLDEVDAPLDDANVGKFTGMIRQFSDNSQFIIVTHNKQTMASVDVIYGVTMQEAGVSKLVPVDFRSLN